MYFDESLAHGELSTPLKDNHLSEDQAVPLAPNTEEAQEGQRTVRKRLLASNSKRQKRSPGKEDSTESKLKTPTKTPTKTPVAKTSAGKSTTKKSAKKTPTVSAKKKKRIAELESEVQEIEENISKLKKQSTNLKSKMTRLAKSEGEVKFPVKDELIEKMDPQGRPLEPLPVPLIKLEDLLPNEAIHDAIAVWNFINSFNKQLSVAVTWDDFIELLKFTHSTSQALIDLFSAPLKLIFSDSLSLNRLHATLPKKVHFSYRLGEEEREGSSQVGIAPSQLMMPNLNNFEDFDSQYNGLKLFPRKLQTDQVDSLRWNAILRGVFLRLEPIRQLRKAVSEANLALQYYQDQENRFSDAAESDPSILQFMHTLQELNRKYYFLPQWIQSRDWGNELESSSSNKKVSFETPSKAERNGEDLVTFITTGKKIALDAETMSRINTPKSKSRNKSSGLNKDAIFNISSNFILNLHEYYEIANLLETKEVHELSPLQKLTILKVLCDACMDTDRIQQLMERNAEERANQIQQMNRLAKEQKLKMKEVSSTKREAALEACRRLNREKASDSKKGEKKEAQGGRKGNGGGKGSKAKSNFEPNVEQLSAMIDDLIGLEPYGIDTVREDPVLDEISESEDEEDDEEEASDEHETDGDNDEGEVKRGRSASRRKPALVRTRAMSRQRSRADRMQRNNTISYALERMTLALERNTERELRGAIKVAEKSGFKGVDEKTGQVYVTESLKQVYRQLNELEIKAKEDKLASKHEKALDDYFVRTEPLGSDRYHRTYWKFMADDNRLFVECKEEDEAMKAFGPCPPPPSSSKALDQIVLNRLFESRPNRYKYRWLVYSTSSELWKLCEALDDRGEREKELKAAIKARFEIEPPAVVYQTSGSEFIGRKVQRTFGRKTVYGTVVGWLPATEEDQALWHVVHVDGDEEDLDEDELKIALVEDEDEAVKEVSVQRDEDEAVQVKESVEELHSLNGRVDDGKDTDDQSEEDEVVVPAIAKKSAGLVRASHHSRSISVSGLHGVEGLAQECQRFLSIVSDSLKKKLGDQFSREEKKNFEQKLRDVESLEDLQKVVLEMEDLIHSCQTASDRREKDECQQAKEEERREMIEEGWTFDEVQCEFIGRRGRRYFSKFGISDGVIVAMLPAERNEGVTLFRMVHNDGDREDLESEDLLTALRYFDSNCTATDIRMELKEREGEDGEDSDDDDDDDLLVDDSSQFSNPRDSSEGLLWPTFEVRQRWKESVSRSCTTGELALAISCLEEHSYDFNLFGESDPILPLTLFSPPMDPETMRLLTQAGRYPQRQRGSAQNFHHEALSPRKAKKRAISEISKCQKEDTRSFSSDDFEPRRSKRVTGNAQTHSNHSSSNNQFYNSGRPSRSAAQKVVSYAV